VLQRLLLFPISPPLMTTFRYQGRKEPELNPITKMAAMLRRRSPGLTERKKKRGKKRH
jgi:hypothetical protein